MQLLFLGTAASEGYPDAFCDCENCQAARQMGGPNLRKRSAALIDDLLLIDFGPDLMAASMMHNVSLANIEYLLQTHEHEDHLDASHFGSRSQACGVFGAPRLHWYASAGAIAKVAQRFAAHLPENGMEHSLQHPEVEQRLNLTVHPIGRGQQFEVGPYRVTSVPANHTTDLETMLHVIEKDGRTLFYCTDTGVLPSAAWQTLAEHRFRFNVVVMDHTFGLTDRGGGHMNSRQFVAQMDKMREINLLADDARIFATHIAHHSNPDHETLVRFAKERGYEIAYDGMLLEV